MNPKIFLSLCCLLFATSCFAEPTTNATQNTTATQPPSKPGNQSNSIAKPVNPTSPENVHKKPNMVGFCKEHTC
jgi:hypothetical protein